MVMKKPSTHEDARERFEAKCMPEPNSGCWLWTASMRGDGYRRNSGYGQFGFNGKIVGAHRFSYELYVGPIPDGLLVLHSCDNRPCVNPDHLRVGTHQDNYDDMSSRGRASLPKTLRGSESGVAKLSEQDVLRVLHMANDGEKYSVVAKRFNVSGSLISAIANGRCWTHLTERYTRDFSVCDDEIAW